MTTGSQPPNTTPRLARIHIFPVKSLPGVSVESVTVLDSGALENDRRWVLCDAGGTVVNGKRTAAIHRLQASFSSQFEVVTLRAGTQGPEATFRLPAQLAAFEAWLSQFFGFGIRVFENSERGFPDDLNSPGPTVISTASLATIAEWFPGMTLDEARQRFRTNLEIDGVEPFWEDHLFTAPGEILGFRIGAVTFEGINPCARCAVPSRHPQTGEPIYQFARIFAQRRQKSLPAWADRRQFDHFYRLAVNTRVPLSEGPRRLRQGDEISLLRAAK